MLFTMTELLPQLLCVVYLMWLSVIGWRCLITISGSPRAFVGVCTMSPHMYVLYVDVANRMYMCLSSYCHVVVVK